MLRMRRLLMGSREVLLAMVTLALLYVYGGVLIHYEAQCSYHQRNSDIPSYTYGCQPSQSSEFSWTYFFPEPEGVV